MNLNEIQEKIFDIKSEQEFVDLCLAVFKHQYQSVPVYKTYCDLLKKTPIEVQSIFEIPFLPISFFKTHEIRNPLASIDTVYTSSGTTGSEVSKHFVEQLTVYKKSFTLGFEKAYPNWTNYAIIGLLPSYLERKGSSLVYMVDDLIQNSHRKTSGFHLDLSEEFIQYITTNPEPKILFGVTFALLQMADKGIQPLNTIIIETGGMKGRGAELTREQLHQVINEKLQPKAIHSEYGMTELLSQAYLKEKTFSCPPWMKVLIREASDPFNILKTGRGAVNIIDLANIHSCSFIATDDLGRLYQDGTFEILGRMDHSQIRGCNLLVI